MKKFIYTLALALILNSAFLIQNCFSQWQPDLRLTNDTSMSVTSFNNAWCVASSGTTVHVVWYDNRNGSSGEIYYKRSTDGGINWGADTRLTNDGWESNYPSVAVSGSVVYIAWQDKRDANWEIYYKRSTDAGVSWGADTRLTINTANSHNPSIAISGSVVHVVWKDNRSLFEQIYYKRTTDGGINWGADTPLSNSMSQSDYPSIAVSGSFVHVTWYDFRDGPAHIYYKRSTDDGTNWGADTRLTTTSSLHPSIAVSGTVVHIIWYDGRDGNVEIYYKRSTDAGVNWEADTRLTNNTANSWTPSVAVSGSVVHVVWYDERDGNYEIYYKRSIDAGINWGTDTRLTNNSANSSQSSVAVSGSVVHVVWHDFRNGNVEIYYKRNPTGNVGIQNISTEIPSKYSLGQNYPNPFNSSSNLKFEISRHGGSSTGNVKIVVYDLMGREVQTLVNERLQSGTYETSFDGSMLNSGVYFYKLITNDFTETKKMLLIK